jgi:hypothetical protein
VTSNELKVYHNGQLVSGHQRSFLKRQRIRNLSHYEKTLLRKPRAKVMAYKVMAYREKLLELDSPAAEYISEICRRDRNTMNHQILKLYALWEEHGTERFMESIRFCYDSGVYGSEYIELMLLIPAEDSNRRNSALAIAQSSKTELLLSGQPVQSDVDRDLAIYDTYSHR